MTEYDKHTSLLRPQNFDDFRANQYDSMLLSDDVDYEIKQKLEYLYANFREVLGEKSSKSLAYSVFRYTVLLKDKEREAARQIGLAHNSLAPEAWQVKTTQRKG